MQTKKPRADCYWHSLKAKLQALHTHRSNLQNGTKADRKFIGVATRRINKLLKELNDFELKCTPPPVRYFGTEKDLPF